MRGESQDEAWSKEQRVRFFVGKSLIILALGKLSGGVFVCLLMLEFVICQTYVCLLMLEFANVRVCLFVCVVHVVCCCGCCCMNRTDHQIL